MKLTIDQNRILCASETIEQGKVYSHEFHWAHISSHDKITFVEHKKQIKTIQFKDIGSNMSVFYIADRKTALWKEPLTLDIAWAVNALTLYKWYDESTDKNYAFLYKYPTNNVNILNTQLHLLWLEAGVHKTEKWLIIDTQVVKNAIGSDTTNVDTIISYLFMLTLLYGKMDIKDTSLVGIKIHIHLFGWYLKEQAIFDTLLYFLQTKGVFLQKSVIQSNDGIIYQISSQDYEILASFAQLYKSIAKIDKIPTFDRMLLSKQSLLSTIQTLQADWSLVTDRLIVDTINTHIVKVITK